MILVLRLAITVVLIMCWFWGVDLVAMMLNSPSWIMIGFGLITFVVGLAFFLSLLIFIWADVLQKALERITKDIY